MSKKEFPAPQLSNGQRISRAFKLWLAGECAELPGEVADPSVTAQEGQGQAGSHDLETEHFKVGDPVWLAIKIDRPNIMTMEKVVHIGGEITLITGDGHAIVVNPTWRYSRTVPLSKLVKRKPDEIGPGLFPFGPDFPHGKPVRPVAKPAVFEFAEAC